MTKNIFLILSDSPPPFRLSDMEKRQIAQALGLAERAIEFRVTQIAGPEAAEDLIRDLQPIGFEIRVMWRRDEDLWTGLGDVGSSTRYYNYMTPLGGHYQWETLAQRLERLGGAENDRVIASLMGRDD